MGLIDDDRGALPGQRVSMSDVAEKMAVTVRDL